MTTAFHITAFPPAINVSVTFDALSPEQKRSLISEALRSTGVSHVPELQPAIGALFAYLDFYVAPTRTEVPKASDFYPTNDLLTRAARELEALGNKICKVFIESPESSYAKVANGALLHWRDEAYRIRNELLGRPRAKQAPAAFGPGYEPATDVDGKTGTTSR